MFVKQDITLQVSSLALLEVQSDVILTTELNWTLDTNYVFELMAGDRLEIYNAQRT